MEGRGSYKNTRHTKKTSSILHVYDLELFESLSFPCDLQYRRLCVCMTLSTRMINSGGQPLFFPRNISNGNWTGLTLSLEKKNRIPPINAGRMIKNNQKQTKTNLAPALFLPFPGLQCCVSCMTSLFRLPFPFLFVPRRRIRVEDSFSDVA